MERNRTSQYVSAPMRICCVHVSCQYIMIKQYKASAAFWHGQNISVVQVTSPPNVEFHHPALFNKNHQKKFMIIVDRVTCFCVTLCQNFVLFSFLSKLHFYRKSHKPKNVFFWSCTMYSGVSESASLWKSLLIFSSPAAKPAFVYNTNPFLYKALCNVFSWQNVLKTHSLEHYLVRCQTGPEGARSGRCYLY